MSGKVRGSRCLGWAFLVVSLWIGAGSARIEAGVTNNGPVEHMYGSSIIEDSDPVGARPVPVRLHRRVPNPESEADGDGLSSVLYNPASRLFIAAWAKRTLDGFDIVVSRSRGGAWSLPAVLAVNATVHEQGRPALAVNPADGSVHLLYREGEDAPRVMHREASADLSSWSEPVQVSLPGEIARRPAGVFHDGVLQVVYESHGPGQSGTPRLIVLATQSGPTFTTQVLGTSSYHESNWILVRSRAGRLRVEWIDGDGEIAWTRCRSDGSWEPVRILPVPDVEQRNGQAKRGTRRQAIR